MIKKLWLNLKEKIQEVKQRKSLYKKIAQEVESEDSNTYLCSYQKCLTCPIATCYTGEMARKKGKKGYIRQLVELELAEEV